MTQEEMAVAMTTEILEGCEGTGIRTGIVGEIGCNWPLFSMYLNLIVLSVYIRITFCSRIFYLLISVADRMTVSLL